MNPILTPKDDRLLASSPTEMIESQNLARSRYIPPNKKISTACLGCKKRKTRCSGKAPCTQCVQRGTISDCLIDSTTDLRRKGVSDRRIDELERDRALLDGILETLRTSTDVQAQTFVHLIRADPSRSDISSYVHAFLQKNDSSTAATDTDSNNGAPACTRQRSICSIRDILNHEPDHGDQKRLPLSLTSARSPNWKAWRVT